MGIKVKGLHGWCIVSLLSAASLAAASNELRMGGGLADAVEKGEKEAVRALLKQHADVNAPQPDGATALAWAAHWDDLETAELLIRAGANVNAANDYGVTPLSLASTNGNAAMVEKLLKAGANPNAALPTGETALMTAARTGIADAVKSLLAHGADVNAKETRQGQTALMWAAAEKHSEVEQALIEHGADVHARSKSGFTPLLFAARQGDLDSVRILLAAGANVNETTRDPEGASVVATKYENIGAVKSVKTAVDGMTALLLASANGYEALSIFLLEKGADPNAADANGFTALHYAVLKGASNIGGVQLDSLAAASYMFRSNMLELVKALLAHGANPNAQILKTPRLPHSNTPRFGMAGATPFLLAAASYDAGLLRLLLASRANPLLATKEGTTPLMVAAGLGRYQDFAKGEERNALEAAMLAVELGVDVNAVGENGYTALHGAAYTGAESIIQFLVEKGAKLEVKDKFQQTPLSIAEGIISPGIVDFSKKPFGPHESAAKLLLKLGATPDRSVAQRSDVAPVNPSH